jgi:hypothetical protein
VSSGGDRSRVYGAMTRRFQKYIVKTDSHKEEGGQPGEEKMQKTRSMLAVRETAPNNFPETSPLLH